MAEQTINTKFHNWKRGQSRKGFGSYCSLSSFEAGWKAAQKDGEVKPSAPSNKSSLKFPTLEEFQRAVRKWKDGLLYMPSLDYLTEHIYSDYIRKRSGN